MTILVVFAVFVLSAAYAGHAGLLHCVSMKMRMMMAAGMVLGSVLAHAGSETLPLGKPMPNKPSVPTNSAAVPAMVEGAPAEPGSGKPYIASVDVYGSPRINEVVLKEILGKDLDTWIQQGLAGDPNSSKLEAKLLDKIKSKFGFAAADWSIVEYFEPGDPALHITLDVVEKDDVAERMPFLPAPTGEFTDPDGLIKAWDEYEDTALELVESGQLEPEADSCVAFHCPFAHVHARLKKYEKIFVDGVKKHAPALMEIQAKDKRPEWRASATYLLAYLKDGKKVVSQMVDRIRDPDAGVRNNALRVLGDVAEFHPELVIPAQPVLEALQFPRVSDRSKAVYVAYLLALNSQQVREQILKTSVATLIQMLENKQPDHRELAHSVLRKVSGKEFAVTDPQSWRNWHARLPQKSNVSRR